MADERTPDIVERLRRVAKAMDVEGGCPTLLREAADEIERLRASHSSREDVIKEMARKYCQSLDDKAPCNELCNPCLNHARLLWMQKPASPLRDAPPTNWVPLDANRPRNPLADEVDPRACNADTSVEPSGRKIG
jgi:hypothetical protein